MFILLHSYKFRLILSKIKHRKILQLFIISYFLYKQQFMEKMLNRIKGNVIVEKLVSFMPIINIIAALILSF